MSDTTRSTGHGLDASRTAKASADPGLRGQLDALVTALGRAVERSTHATAASADPAGRE